jgi:hypothetical protein
VKDLNQVKLNNSPLTALLIREKEDANFWENGVYGQTWLNRWDNGPVPSRAIFPPRQDTDTNEHQKQAPA